MSNVNEQLLTLNKISKKSVSLYHKFALSIGISDSALGVLYALLDTDKPCTQYDLCNEWFIPKQTINTAVTSLQNKGFISLLPVSGTRNKKNIILTEKGRELINKTIFKLYKAEIEAFESLSVDERETFIRLNKKYNETLAKNINDFMQN